MAQSSYQAITLTSNTTLTWPFSFAGGLVVADRNDVTVVYSQVACYAATIGTNLVATYNNGTAGIGATLTNNTTLAAFSIDGVSPPALARILVKDQTLAFQNGIYTLTTIGNISTAWVLTRASDYNTPSQIQIGNTIAIMNGTVNTETVWQETAAVSTIGTDPITFVSQNDWAITLPNATLASNGQFFLFNNVSIYPFQVVAQDGVTLLATIQPSQVFEFYLSNYSTPNGLWRVIPYGGGSSSIAAFTVESSDASIIVNDGNSVEITPPGGVINIQLPESLSNLNFLGSGSNLGIPIITGLNPLTWQVVSLINGTNITIINPTGVAGSPIINVNPNLTAIESAAIGNLSITASTIIATNSNGNVILTSLGTGTVQLNTAVIDGSGNLSGINNLNITGIFNSPTLPKAWVSFTDTGGTINIAAQYGITSITKTSPGVYVALFTTAFGTTNYAPLFSFGASSDIIPLIPRGGEVLKQLDQITFAVIDDSGQLVTQIPFGATITIMSL